MVKKNVNVRKKKIKLVLNLRKKTVVKRAESISQQMLKNLVLKRKIKLVVKKMVKRSLVTRRK